MFHSFVDESKRDSYLLVAAFVPSTHLANARRAIASMVMPGQRRIHFHSERDSRRSQILDRLSELPIEAVIYEVGGKVHENIARARCLTLLIRDHLERGAHRLVIEHEDTHKESDQRILRREIRRFKAEDRITWEHLRAHDELLLAIPDAVAWCWPKRGHWRVKAKGLVTDVLQA